MSEKPPEVEVITVSRPSDEELEQHPEVASYIEQVEGQFASLTKDVDQQPGGEARGIVFVDLWGVARDSDGNPHKVQFNLTARSMSHPINAIKVLLETVTYCKTIGVYPYIPELPYPQKEHQPAPQASDAQYVQVGATTPAPTAPTGTPVAPPPPAGQQTQTNGNPYKQGSGSVKLITVKEAGKAEITIEGLKYPLSDSRGGTVIAGLFDPVLGWTAEHFGTPTIYTPEQFGQLFCDWESPEGSKYYNIVKIHA